ncbi:sugar ABC transporter permease [Halolactibacillus alkaliphilus]|uniref:Sugar ABC transporter permease n=2 Tax=Halolactibacillus alkaliphilus TaxID=442899 RepID=A0A511WZP9_9BACI|nr:carbohydrate ABC transporter permease [Halolactibacillus alkaliphilus]GEN56164.1 sugar ABC transporter permease [Halolactibacillus alkaliphilus]GGN66807.1 sugar ABC transporter permease [Halolactibacillus alkaliphilus]SFO72110.1 carbohydrate ABC transporter membrane protein 2, CUT1 family (TC 3.A.1.1.-) [Halolactibacillus alkaliphilus]
MMKKRLTNGFYRLGFILISVVVGLPLYYLVVTTFKTPEEAALSPLGLPSSLNFTNYQRALEAMNYGNALKNNLIITVSAVILLVVFASMAAYVISRSQSKLFKTMYNIFLVGLIIPFQIAIVPLYQIISGLNLMNTHLGVILVSVFCINLPLSIFLLRGFISTVPVELEEAAFLDGCGTFKTFWLIIFPLLKPIISTVVILNALAIWNDFLTPLLFLQSPDKAVLLQEVYKNVGPFSTNWTSFFPMLVLSVLPLVVFYIIMQKRVIEGVVAGSVKG